MKKLRIIAAVLAIAVISLFAACSTAPAEQTATDAPAQNTGNAAPTDVPATEAPATKAPTDAPTQAPTQAPTATPEPEPTVDPSTVKLLIPYVTKGLVALYEGGYNTEDGQKTDSTTWQDLSGNGNDMVDIKLGDNCYWTEEGLYVDTVKILFPDTIPELINSDAYTVEFSIKDLVVTGANFATFLNSDVNDNFALFIRVADNSLEFKCNSGIGQRPKVSGSAMEDCENCTMAVTFSAGDVVELYLNGELVADHDAAINTDMAGHFFIGHTDPTKTYHGVVTGVRFYDRVLSEKELRANYQAQSTVKANPDYVPPVE